MELYITGVVELGLELEARVEYSYKAEIPPRRTGHPDNWDEGEEENIEVLELKAITYNNVWSKQVPKNLIGKVAIEHEAMFLLESNFGEDIIDALMEAAGVEWGKQDEH